MLLNRFNVLILKIIFKKLKKYYFNTFLKKNQYHTSKNPEKNHSQVT
jgi:hypothetical protein